MSAPQVFQTPLLNRILGILREEVDPEFAFLQPGPIPWAEPPASLPDTTVALVTTGGLHLRGDAPFRSAESRLGDTSFRVVPLGARPGQLVLDAVYVDQKYTAGDPECALPLRALEALHLAGVIGPPAARHYSFVGGIVRPYPGLGESAELLRRSLREDGVGTVVLLPTCSLCVQTVCLLAREIEASGIPTVTLTLIPELSDFVGAPRALAVKFPFGAPAGDPGNEELHRQVLARALELAASAVQAGERQDAPERWRRA